MNDLDFSVLFDTHDVHSKTPATRPDATPAKRATMKTPPDKGEVRWRAPCICENGEVTTLFFYNIACRDCGRLFVDARGPKTQGRLARCEECRQHHKQEQAVKRKIRPKPLSSVNAQRICGSDCLMM